MEKLKKIFFDEVEHKYTDEYGNIYTSMTTCLGKYHKQFDTHAVAEACSRIGRNPTHPKYLKYKGKSKSQLIAEWDATTQVALNKGNKRHNYLEDIINKCNGYITSDKKYAGNRTYTIQDIKNDSDFGRIDISYFQKSGLEERYPAIYSAITSLHNNGYKFYAEIAVFDENRLISGLIDLLAVNFETRYFIIIDWKTNKDEMMDIAGYFEKDKDGNTLEKYIETNEYLFPPIDNVPASTKHKYSMQVSGYAVMVERFGFKNKGNIIFHIREHEDKITKEITESVTLVRTFDLHKEADIMFTDHYKQYNIKTQKKLFYE